MFLPSSSVIIYTGTILIIHPILTIVRVDLALRVEKSAIINSGKFAVTWPKLENSAQFQCLESSKLLISA